MANLNGANKFHLAGEHAFVFRRSNSRFSIQTGDH
jgi:hypothetical protein